jgi:hypothetical protein
MSITTGLFVASFFSAFRHFSELGVIDIDPEKEGVIIVPPGGYVLENGVDFYVAEDGVTYYVQES